MRSRGQGWSLGGACARLLGPAVAAGALSLAAVAGEVYRWVDAEGIVHFTNIRPDGVQNYATLRFPCYASDPSCRRVDWEQVPLDTQAFAQEIRRSAAAHALDESLIRAIIHAESAYQPDAVSPRGARGLMQLMPETQQELAVADVFSPASNIEGGTSYLARLLDEFDDNLDLALAAYNAGPGAVRTYGGIPPFAETREYIRRITILYRRYRAAGA